MIRARVEDKLKCDVEKIFNKLGLNTTEAITLYYKQILLHQGLPFSIKIPNKTTLKTFRETDNNTNIVETENFLDLMHKLEI
ncbi:MAG: Toxin-antitoxin system, antitoxin component, ribbon-helix-helix domain protein [Candidatus Falkowbacteria bacterium GW2011_GWC2_38_22]|uniref:Toxin-antitoxin system, antitoxin component, ribbon-helix-helix domain protein n=1 Tax=Candidatus Falkowbacteria bacterium GW2011_GWE1_38_31 TaxID=1618638 RepID=A0A0G0JRK8_9BACT|nr:MAG: Toxin-antitoxin system, antitoxin component, ribbon-helix-helix domain protein [Candidatus Falkowbacteria bacterium GW2011_GWF2_38_1205]KKQ61067.1 MAG: Toxin-antitoxin system, antitoxin component, ribbon-helix-helix domain protein [Candidatus Falkowbacteria bacterium GW2011_GWC2_38_22]KKQ63404.1 MAG: Toxin-antitoxin system, antitoxin component, ribbon-helix-helix domain protein [Candidatus Falkowbacteria bacterium GW2011_GWF1_38_22]KKQ65525.1 MAG: Toxin-antitoxin system, antitoxin compon